MIKAIIFDFYGVLSIRGPVAFLERVVPDSKDLADLREIGRQRDLGFVTMDDFYQAVADVTGMQPHEISQHMHHERAINQPLIDFIRTDLKPTYKIGMLSNAASDLSTYIPRQIMRELFDDVLISSTVGLVKPDPQIYLLACQRLGVEPAEAIMVDDLPDNCKGAKAAGLQAVCYDDWFNAKAQLIVKLTK